MFGGVGGGVNNFWEEGISFHSFFHSPTYHYKSLYLPVPRIRQ